jgi:hypothetical protein
MPAHEALMEYQLIPDILGIIILTATFALCLRSFRREDQKDERPVNDVVPRHQSLAELLNLMDESIDRTVRVAHSGIPGTKPGDDLDGIEVTVRVNQKRGLSRTSPMGTSEVVNAVWEPLPSLDFRKDISETVEQKFPRVWGR